MASIATTYIAAKTNLLRLPMVQLKQCFGYMPFSPLEQFSIIPLLHLKLGSLYLSFTNASVFMLLTILLFLLLVHLATKTGGVVVPNAMQYFVELLFEFVLKLVNAQIGQRNHADNTGFSLFPCILVTFTWLLLGNLFGMIPYSFTVTSQLIVTGALSFSLFIGITLVGFNTNGFHFFSLLLPGGVPLTLAPFLVLLELISYCFRSFSLGIRLFANLMAGHSLVKILSGFAWTMLAMGVFSGICWVGLGPLFLVFALTGLEFMVAILQSYVFTILMCIYLNDAITLH